MQDQVTVHALESTNILVGNGCSFGRHSLLHGGQDGTVEPKQITIVGDNVSVGVEGVLFRSKVGNGCSIGNRSYVDGCHLAAGTVVPANTVLVNDVNMGTVEW